MSIGFFELPNCLPDFELPKGYENTDKYIRHLIAEGLEKRYKDEVYNIYKEYDTID